MQPPKCLALFALILTSTSCSGLVVRQFDSNPSGAKIFVNGEPAGNTLASIAVDFSVTPVVRILIIQPKYRPHEKTFFESTFPKHDLVGEKAIQLARIGN